MKCRLRLGIVAWLICGAFLFAQSSPSSTEQKQEPPASNSDTQASKQPQMGIAGGPIEIVSDTLGVNFGPYLQDVLKSVKQNWYNLIPESARGPLKKKGKVLIEFKILKDGKVAGMKLVESTGDMPLDRAALSGITTSGPFPRLPAEFSGPHLGLRFSFYYNLTPAMLRCKKLARVLLQLKVLRVRASRYALPHRLLCRYLSTRPT
jgi:TonB family protein